MADTYNWDKATMQVSVNFRHEQGQRKSASWAGFRAGVRGAGNSLFSLVILGSFSLIVLSGCAVHHEIESGYNGAVEIKALSPPGAPACVLLPAASSPIVFCADGAGDFRVSSTKLRDAACEAKTPMHVVSFLWSHGYLRVFADQGDMNNFRCKGQRLADAVMQCHQEEPSSPIYLLGHSAGCMVLLAALEDLPPGIVERCLMLSPSHSNCYDLRPALAHVNKGIHVFYSCQDQFYLNAAMHFGGRTCPGCSTASGQTGYHVYIQTPQDQALYAKLYQRPWTPADEPTGNMGGHFDNYVPGFIRQEILPLLLGRESTIPAAAMTAP